MSAAPVRTRVKFCGLTRPVDVRLAGELGVDAIGLVFASGSPRALDLPRALRLREAAAPFVAVVALFMDADADRVGRVVDALAPDLLQFHGREDPAYCAQFGRPYLRAIPMRDAAADPAAMAARHPSAAAFLFDAHGLGEAGGTGARFDLARLPTGLGRPALVAGGLDPDNVSEVIRVARPWGVDVSSGIERAPGIKDAARMRRFVEAVRRADGQRDGDA